MQNYRTELEIKFARNWGDATEGIVPSLLGLCQRQKLGISGPGPLGRADTLSSCSSPKGSEGATLHGH